MTPEALRTALLSALEQAAPAHGIDIVDVEIAGSSRAPIIRLRIDNADESLPTISLDEVAQQHEWINATLDEMDPIEGSYTLEVSSPGLARPLRKHHDFERFAHETVQLQTNNTEGRKRFSGKLCGIDDNDVVTVVVDGEDMQFLRDTIVSCTIKPEF